MDQVAWVRDKNYDNGQWNVGLCPALSYPRILLHPASIQICRCSEGYDNRIMNFKPWRRSRSVQCPTYPNQSYRDHISGYGKAQQRTLQSWRLRERRSSHFSESKRHDCSEKPSLYILHAWNLSPPKWAHAILLPYTGMYVRLYMLATRVILDLKSGLFNSSTLSIDQFDVKSINSMELIIWTPNWWIRMLNYFKRTEVIKTFNFVSIQPWIITMKLYKFLYIYVYFFSIKV